MFKVGRSVGRVLGTSTTTAVPLSSRDSRAAPACSCLPGLDSDVPLLSPFRWRFSTLFDRDSGRSTARFGLNRGDLGSDGSLRIWPSSDPDAGSCGSHRHRKLHCRLLALTRSVGRRGNAASAFARAAQRVRDIARRIPADVYQQRRVLTNDKRRVR